MKRIVTLGAGAAMVAALAFLTACGSSGTSSPTLTLGCSDCPTTASTCAGLTDALKCLKADRADFQEQLQEASTSQKSYLAGCIKQLNAAIDGINKQLSACP